MTDKEKIMCLVLNADSFERMVGCRLFIIYGGEKIEAKEFLQRIQND